MLRNLTFGLLVVLAIFSCKKGNDEVPTPNTPLNTQNDSLLLKIINYENFVNNQIGDSIITIIKKSTIGGLKRVTMSRIDQSAPMDTIFTIYNYNNQDQLIEKREYDKTVPNYTGVCKITWSGNKVIKILYEENGIISETHDFIYATVGNNIEVYDNRFPSFADTTYSGGVITRISNFKQTLTMNNQYTPLYSNFYYTWDYSNGGQVVKSRDTTKLVYNYDNLGNSNSQIVYYVSHSTDNYSTPQIRLSRDTQTLTFARNISENPTLYNLKEQIYGI